jgi:hypothetical protein
LRENCANNQELVSWFRILLIASPTATQRDAD